MHRVLTRTRYIVLIGVIGLLVGSLASFALNIVVTGELVWHIFTNLSDPNLQVEEVYFLKLVDGFLISTGLLIFGLGLYEIFIYQLDLPAALRFTTIGQLKASLANIIILTLAISFLASIQENDDASTVLLKGVATAVIIIVLVLFARSGEQDTH